MLPSFLSLLDDDPPNLRVAHIANANDRDWSRFFPDKTVNHLVGLGFNVEKVDLRRQSAEEIYQTLEAKDIIYIGGGNTFYLLNLLRQRKLNEILSDLIGEGKVYLGASAGSIVAGPDITPASWKPFGDKNSNKMTELSGLNLVNFSTLPHYLPEFESLIRGQKQAFSHRVYCLSNGQAVSVVGDHHEVIGEGNSLDLV